MECHCRRRNGRCNFAGLLQLYRAGCGRYECSRGNRLLLQDSGEKPRRRLFAVFQPFGPITPRKAIIVDNGDHGYSESGTWGDSTLPRSYDGSSRYSNAAGSTAKWTLDVDVPGYYHVYVRYPYHQTSYESVAYSVYHNGADNTICRRPDDDRGRMAHDRHRLFRSGGDQYVMLTAGSIAGSGNVEPRRCGHARTGRLRRFFPGEPSQPIGPLTAASGP